jgi:nucleotide-binding universal stress UspA family protein
MFQRILLAWDGSDLALRACDVAVDVARRYDAELVAVSVSCSPAHAETAADRTETTNAAHAGSCGAQDGSGACRG